jgi:putative peptidoglycan lipid II flippase
VASQVAGLVVFQLLSPAAALLAEVALAWRFGASGIVDAYRVIVLLLIYGQQLFVTHILPCVLVPIFAEYRAKNEEREAWVIADSIGRMLLIFGSLIAAGFFLRPDAVVSVAAPGLAGEARATALFLIRWCGLAFIPMCWTGAACGVLYAYNVFQLAPLSQMASNLIVVLAIAIGGGKLGAASLAVGLTAGSFTAAGIHVFRVSALRRQFGPHGCPTHVDFKALGKAFRVAAPLLGSAIAGQSTSVVVNRVLSRLPVGTLAAFGYAYKMGTLVRLTPTALTTVLFPKFSATWYTHGRGEFTAGCERSLRATIYMALPVTAVCWAFRRPLMVLLFQRGAFTSGDATFAGALFGLLILNGPPAAAAIALSRAFYAVQETRIPVLTDLTGSMLEFIFIPLLTAHYGAQGAAAAYMVIPWITTAALIVLFRVRFGALPFGERPGFVFWTVAAALLSAWIGRFFGDARVFAGSGIVSSALQVAVGGSVALGAYYVLTLFAGLPESRTCQQFLRRAASALKAWPRNEYNEV